MIMASKTSPKKLLDGTWNAWKRQSWRVASAISLVLAGVVALVSYRYVLAIPPVPDGIAANAFGKHWLVLHAGFASTALLLGAVQFSPVPRHRSPSFHRVVGRMYVVACLVGALSGFVLALGTSAGPIASIGFGLLSTAWTTVNLLGWQRARTGQYASHRRWMIRSWALTLSAVTLRLLVPIAEIADLPSDPAYQAISFLCWVPNLVVAELILHYRRRSAEMPLRLQAT
jgi:uncharacterized membrane protein